MAGLNNDTKLLLHLNGVDGSKEIQDSGDTGHIVTQVGTAQLSTTQKKFGSCSLLLDGDSDYLTVPDSADFSFGTDNFTIDFWVKFAEIKKSVFLDKDAASALSLTYNHLSDRIYFENRGGLTFYASWNPSVDTWYHIAYIRLSSADANTSWAIAIDGILKTGGNLTLVAGSWDDAVNTGAGNLLIGYEHLESWYTNGYFDEYRISKGVARWTEDFDVPTDEYTSDSDTKLLLHMNSLDVSGDGGSGNYHIPKFYGTAQLDTAVKKWGSGALLLDGDSDYLLFPDSPDWDILTQTYVTVDCWIKPTDLSGAEIIVVQREDDDNRWMLWLNGANVGYYVTGDDGGFLFQGSYTLVDTNWHHIAFIKVGTDYGLYVDGVQRDYTSDANTDTFTGDLKIGWYGTAGTYFAGHIDEMRIQHSNYFEATPNSTPDDTITVPTEEYTSVTTYEVQKTINLNLKKVGVAVDEDVEVDLKKVDISSSQDVLSVFEKTVSVAKDVLSYLLKTYATQKDVILALSKYSISGQVTLSGSPVEGATVRIINTTDENYVADVLTDASGNYSFYQLTSGKKYHVVVEYETGGQKYNAESYWYIDPHTN